MSDDEGEDALEWVLGFAAKPSNESSVLRHKFPSKIGGLPAWLDPVHLPRREQLQSLSSKEPLSFLLQIYCPVEGNSEAFHRTLFLFTSTTGKDLHKQGNVRAYRCQLPKENKFYASVPSKDRWPCVPEEGVCAEAEEDPWRVLESEARLASGEPALKPEDRHVFPEYQLQTDYEEEPSAVSSSTLNGAHERVDEDPIQDSDVGPDIEAAIHSATTDEQKHFAEFAARISWEPDQVIRYCFQEEAQPLWPNPKPIPRADEIPACPQCSCPRRFEFEVLPQLLNYLDVDNETNDSLDWSAIAIYSCPNSCTTKEPYQEEFVYVQPS